MSKQAIIGLSAAVVAVVAGGVLLTTGQQSDVNQDNAATTTDDTGITRTISALHQYNPDSGQHIVAGTTTVPTPCHVLTTDTEIRESDPEQVTINFSADKENENAVCAQQIQEARFKVTFEASENAQIEGGTFGDDQVELNLQEVGANENLEEFEVYTKG